MSSLVLVSIVFAVPARADPNRHLTGSVRGSVGPSFRDDACPVKIVGFQHGLREVVTGTVAHQGRSETLTASVCIFCCSPGGESLHGAFAITTPGGMLTGNAQGSSCSCAIPITFQLTLTVTHGTREFAHHAGQIFLLQGSFEGEATFEGAFASNTTLTTSP
jgi:hypothetical protein